MELAVSVLDVDHSMDEHDLDQERREVFTEVTKWKAECVFTAVEELVWAGPVVAMRGRDSTMM